MARAKTVISTWDTLHKEAFGVAKDLGATRVALAETADKVARYPNDAKIWAPDLAEPTARYTLAKDRYDAICDLLEVAGRSNYEDLSKFDPYVRARARYDAAYAS